MVSKTDTVQVAQLTSAAAWTVMITIIVGLKELSSSRRHTDRVVVTMPKKTAGDSYQGEIENYSNRNHKSQKDFAFS